MSSLTPDGCGTPRPDWEQGTTTETPVQYWRGTPTKAGRFLGDTKTGQR
ncbi:hypothetical protein [Granulosicoccus antarcticus]|uniref:Uncharacterized protein n=1 Tax=Granulosicoccus antarcticus IMCC3135 TaxID=1192854 RepID=A0A2Z2NI22_9GAMM|nr:hypothetical protein [Granulosicoccus antarcticus]ASJ70799.1 hypothetical protein IMCC3135_03430 [Granulosicoccus antarcticus IMCC3135]